MWGVPGFGDADIALGVLFGLVTGFSAVLTAAGESDFLGDGEEAGGIFGDVPVITLDDPVNGLGDPGITFGELEIDLGPELDGPATPLMLFFLNVSLTRRLLGGEAFTLVDSTEARC